MTASNTFGRATVWALTNKSGGGVIAGDVVIVDTTNNDAFTTTTSSATTQIVGIATGTIASNAAGLVLLSGYASLVNVNASVTRGHYGVTHTVAKQATDGGATRTTGTFCEFLTGGTTPDAIIFNPDLGGASLTNPMSAKGQLIQGDTGGAPVALAVGTAGQVLTSGGAAAFNTWGAGPFAPWLVDIIAAFSSPSSNTNFAIGGWNDNVSYRFVSGAGATALAEGMQSSGAQNDEISWKVPLSAGTWNATIYCRIQTTNGIYTLNLDTVSQGTADSYGSLAAGVLAINGWTVATDGAHVVQLKMATKNGSASNYYGQLFGLSLRRTA